MEVRGKKHMYMNKILNGQKTPRCCVDVNVNASTAARYIIPFSSGSFTAEVHTTVSQDLKFLSLIPLNPYQR